MSNLQREQKMVMFCVLLDPLEKSRTSLDVRREDDLSSLPQPFLNPSGLDVKARHLVLLSLYAVGILVVGEVEAADVAKEDAFDGDVHGDVDGEVRLVAASADVAFILLLLVM
jgi:uncharacterized protein YcgL (UPF0745 family)